MFDIIRKEGSGFVKKDNAPWHSILRIAIDTEQYCRLNSLKEFNDATMAFGAVRAFICSGK